MCADKNHLIINVIFNPVFLVLLFSQLDGSGHNVTVVRNADEIRMVVIGNLTAYTYYSVTVTAFTGDVADARRDGMSSEPVTVRTLEGGENDCLCLMSVCKVWSQFALPGCIERF